MPLVEFLTVNLLFNAEEEEEEEEEEEAFEKVSFSHLNLTWGVRRNKRIMWYWE